MAEIDFARLVTLACHDLRTPLATVNGFAKTLARAGSLDEREARFVDLIDQGAEQMADLIDLLGLAARIVGDRYEPVLQDEDTLELATSEEDGIEATGTGEPIETDGPAVRRALAALASAAARHGSIESTTWTVRGRSLQLAPVNAAAAPVVTAEEAKDLGALVARMTIERLGGSLTLDGETLLVQL